jgi:hypothetical protein
MVAEILAGIALVNSAVKGIKGAIGTAKDISEIANDIDNLFAGTKQVKQQSHPLASKWDKFLGKTLGASSDRFSIGAIAKETIEEKLAEEQIVKVKKMVNLRFGGGTWDDILLEREKRIETHKKRLKKHKAEKAESKARLIKILETIGSAVILISTCAVVFYVILVNMKGK